MKICVCGKGGSGKSTVVALLAAAFRDRSKSVLVVDSDESNACLHWMLGFDEPPAALMDLAGGKKRIQQALRAGTAADGESAGAGVLAQERLRPNDLPENYIRRVNGLGLVCIGKIHQALEGCACPMGVLSREFLKKLQVDDDEVVLVDMEAGIEHFGRGVETSVDAVVAVVEPSLESVNLAERIKNIAAGTGATFAGAILNKVDSGELESKLADALRRRDTPMLGKIPFSHEFVRSALDGTAIAANPVAVEVRSLVDSILSVLRAPAIS
jgi:CO dehydrogenase maturation factor